MTNVPDTTPGRQIQAVQTSCDVLKAIRMHGPIGVTELTNILDVSKSTIHGHLSTLYRNEYVAKEGEKYRLGLIFVDLGEYIKNNMEVYDSAKTEVNNLADKTGEVVQFMVEEHGRGMYLYKSVGERGVKTRSSVGDRKYLHSTALGKAILSELPEEGVDEIVDRHGLPAFTEQTITDREELDAELAAIRERGVAFDDEEILPGLRCVAAPLVGYDGQLFGAISVTGPISRMKGVCFREEIPELVLGSANVVQINSTQS